MVYKALVAAVIPYLATASTPPSYSGYNLIWSDDFDGSSGTSPSSANWNIITGTPSGNDEIEVYTTSTANVHLSGGTTLQIVPWLNSGTWTSGRIESTYVFTPTAGGLTRVEASIRFGNNSISDKQGLWPAFWMLGNEIREGGTWPACGELDILEMIDGQLTGYGTAHCDVDPGGICNEPDGLGASIAVPDQQWHTWRIDFDANTGNWETESITWSMDGTGYHTLTGADIGDESVWDTLCHNDLYIILNMAVGGSWPGDPNSSTEDGYGSMMEVAYVAQYAS